MVLAALLAGPGAAPAAGAPRPETVRAAPAARPAAVAAPGNRTALRRAPPAASRPAPRIAASPPRSRAPAPDDARGRRRAAAAEWFPPRGLPPKAAGSPQPPARAPVAHNARQHAAPQIDGPPPPSRRPGWDPAPVPHSNVLPPLADRRGGGPDVSFGVPTPPQLIEGQSFRGADSAPQSRQQQQQGGGPRLPSPGATVRLPF